MDGKLKLENWIELFYLAFIWLKIKKHENNLNLFNINVLIFKYVNIFQDDIKLKICYI